MLEVLLSPREGAADAGVALRGALEAPLPRQARLARGALRRVLVGEARARGAGGRLALRAVSASAWRSGTENVSNSVLYRK